MKRKKTLTTKNTHIKNKSIHTEKSKTKYVKDKAVMAGEMYKMIHQTDYKFDVMEQFNDRDFDLFTNLKEEYKSIYIILLIDFIERKGNISDIEKLIWTSEFLEILNENHNEFLEIFIDVINEK